MKSTHLAPLLLFLLAGCGGSGLVGTYQSEIRHTGNVTKERAEQQKSEPPHTLRLDGNGSFSTMRGTQTVWKGRWRVESEKLLLRAEEVNGVAVTPALQADVAFAIQKDGTIVDSRTSGDGYERVYRRK